MYVTIANGTDIDASSDYKVRFPFDLLESRHELAAIAFAAAVRASRNESYARIFVMMRL